MAPETIVERYLPFVKELAERIHRRLPPGIDKESLQHSGIVGLLEAARRYDPEQRVDFRTFAQYRIQGEMIEYLRSYDWASRSVRHWGRRLETARARVECLYGRTATGEDMARAVGLSLEGYYRLQQRVNEATVERLDDVPEAAACFEAPFDDPCAAAEEQELPEKLAQTVRLLPTRERTILALYCHENMTLLEIGAVLRLTEGRVCQLFGDAIGRLRRMFTDAEVGEL